MLNSNFKYRNPFINHVNGRSQAILVALLIKLASYRCIMRYEPTFPKSFKYNDLLTYTIEKSY